jgi:hypothetical protein
MKKFVSLQTARGTAPRLTSGRSLCWLGVRVEGRQDLYGSASSHGHQNGLHPLFLPQVIGTGHPSTIQLSSTSGSTSRSSRVSSVAAPHHVTPDVITSDGDLSKPTETPAFSTSPNKPSLPSRNTTSLISSIQAQLAPAHRQIQHSRPPSYEYEVLSMTHPGLSSYASSASTANRSTP